MGRGGHGALGIAKKPQEKSRKQDRGQSPTRRSKPPHQRGSAENKTAMAGEMTRRALQAALARAR